MNMKIGDPRQEWKKTKSQDSKTKTLKLGNEHRQVVIMGSCKNRYKTKLITYTLALLIFILKNVKAI